ncbi:MAG: hypothetical protein RLZZ628_1294 [Bacteroidota bacterium]
MGTTINGKAITIRETFSRTTTVSIDIQSNLAIVWELLTDAAAYPNWNKTVISIDGDIQLGRTILLKSTLDPKRTFKLKIKTVDEYAVLAWGDGQGTRTYTLEPIDNQMVRVTMTEKIGGWMFPLYAKQLPSFDASFEQFAGDLKKAAEDKTMKDTL